jgi:ATP-binding cassette, subfamily B, heavy metal transporter
VRGLRRPDHDLSSSDPTTADWRILRRLLPDLTPFWKRIALAMACLIGAKLATVSLPLLMKQLVDALDGAGAQTLVSVPLGLLLAYGLLRLSSILFGELRDVIFGRVGERVVRRAAGRVLSHLHQLELAFHLERRTGGLSRDLERGMAGISFLLRFMLFNILPTLLEIVLVAGILLTAYGVAFAMITLAAVVTYVAFSVWVTRWRTQFLREANRLDAEANTRAIDSLLNYETVKYFNNEAHEAAAYDEALKRWEQMQARSRGTLAGLNSGQALIIAAAMTAMMVLAARGVAAGEMTQGDFVAVNAFMMQLFIPLNLLGFVYREIRRALTDMGQMFGLLDRSPAIASRAGAIAPATRHAEIRFERVGFGYTAARQILTDVSFVIAPGRKLAIVGASGAGKSTLARLLFRFYDVSSGVVKVDGVDVRAWQLDALRRQIGVVPQDTVLFNATLGDNIRYGRPDASEAALQKAVSQAHLTPFVERLPQGLDTPVGERGLKLSGGERQRVAIARALLKDPPILILDEATSSLDSAAEQSILTALRGAAQTRTTLVIAHRLSTVTDADEILVLAAGTVVERGDHGSLLAAGGDYARLWRLQQAVPDAD